MSGKRTPRVNLAKHNAVVVHDQATAAHKTADEAKKASAMHKTADEAKKAAAVQKTADGAKKAAAVRKTPSKAANAATALHVNAMQTEPDETRKNRAVEDMKNEAVKEKKKAKKLGKVQKNVEKQALDSHAEARGTSPDSQHSRQGTLLENDTGAPYYTNTGPNSQASPDSGILSLGKIIREDISNVLASQGGSGVMQDNDTEEHVEIDTTESDEDENVPGYVFEETSQETLEVAEEEEGEVEEEASSAINGKIDTTGFPPLDWPIIPLYDNCTITPLLAPGLMQDMSEMQGGIAILLAGSILAKMEVSEGVSRTQQTMIRKKMDSYEPKPFCRCRGTG